MATLPYIGSNQRVTAALMNRLWSEFDRKMTLTMNGKSWLLWQDDATSQAEYIERITGPRFFFTNITTFGRSKDIAGHSSPNYNHATFTAAAAAGTPSAPNDHTNKIVFLTIGGGVDLDDSLEAHKFTTTDIDSNPADYWIWQDARVMPQRLHRFAAAELIFEEDGTTDFTVPKEYNKYSYFRVHNLNAVEITVTFEQDGFDDFVLVIPAWGCKCCQRRPRGPLEAGYNYFWKFKPGDPRSLTEVPFGANTAAESMGINNVWNPALLYQIIDIFSDRSFAGLSDFAGLNSVRMIRDPHIVYDLYPLYRDFFDDPANGATLLGDILHHKGEVHYNYRDTGDVMQRVVGEFNGYADLGSLSAMGLTVVTGGTGVTVQGTNGNEFNDLVTPGSNILFSSGVITAEEISSVRGLIHTQPISNDGNALYNEMYLPVDETTGTQSSSYHDYTVDADGNPSLGGTHSVSYTGHFVGVQVSDETAVLYPHVDTVATALTFNTFGMVALNGDNQDTAVATLENRRIVLTQFGPMIFWEERYDFIASTLGGSGIYTGTSGILEPGRPFSRVDGGQLVEHRFALWPGYGWPDYPKNDHVAPVAYNGSTGAFIGPRKTRKFDEYIAGGHPNYANPTYGPDGEDFSLVMSPQPECFARLLFTPGYASPSAGQMPVWIADDQLIEYEATLDSEPDYVSLRSSMQGAGVTSGLMPRVKMLREHYNTMAAWVNSCVKARPFCFSDFLHYLPSTTESGYAFTSVVATRDNGPLSTAGPPIGTAGILETSVRPMSQFTSFVSGSFLDHLFTALGVTIKDVSDMPDSFASLLTTDGDKVRFRGHYNRVIDTVTDISGGMGTNWEYKQHDELTFIEQVDATESGIYKIGQMNAFRVFDASSLATPGVIPGGVESPNHDDIDLSAYLWVSIEDVKAAAEAMGFLFIFEERCLPCSLQEFSVGGSYSTILDYGPFYYETEATMTPASPGVRDTKDFGFNLVLDPYYPPAFDKGRVRFLPSGTSANWKRDPQYSLLVADVIPADIYTYTPQGGQFVLEFTSVPSDYAKWDQDQQNFGIAYRRAQCFQIVASADYTIAAGAWRIPVKWWSYSSSDFSTGSDDAARARWAITDGNRIYPFTAVGSYGSPSFVSFTSGANMLAPVSGRGDEIVIWRDNYVDLS